MSVHITGTRIYCADERGDADHGIQIPTTITGKPYFRDPDNWKRKHVNSITLIMSLRNKLAEDAHKL
jgi:hypothetical protein